MSLVDVEKMKAATPRRVNRALRRRLYREPRTQYDRAMSRAFGGVTSKVQRDILAKTAGYLPPAPTQAADNS